MCCSDWISVLCCFYKEKTADELRISDGSADVWSSDLSPAARDRPRNAPRGGTRGARACSAPRCRRRLPYPCRVSSCPWRHCRSLPRDLARPARRDPQPGSECRPSSAAPSSRSEEHTSELQSLMRISYAVFCLQK